MAGEIGAAGSALGSGFTGAGAAGAATATAAPTGLVSTAMAAPTATSVATLPVQNTAFTGATETGLATLPGDAANVLNKTPSSFMGNMMNSPYAAPAAIMSGTQLIGGAMQGYGAQQEAKRQEKMSADARARYNTNVNTRLFGG